MAWNEPGGGNRDPWSGKGGDQGPPDLDEVVKKLQDKVGGIFGGKRGGGGSGGSRPPGRGGIAGIGSIIAVVIVVILLVQAFYIVEPAERGVIKRFGAYAATTDPGPHFLIPFVDEVVTVDVDQVNEFPLRVQMLTKDENIVDVAFSVQYRIQDPADYLFQDASPEKTISGATESALRDVVGKSRLDDIITENRSAIAAAVQTGTQELLELYRTGLLITNVNIQDASPPEQVKEAFDDAIKAREDKESLQNQAQTYANGVVPVARGEAARVIEDAKAYKAKITAEADGESQRFLALLREYEKAPKITRERLYLDTVQEVLQNSSKVLLDIDKGNNLTYLPLDRLIQQPPVKAGDRRDGGGSFDIAPQTSAANTDSRNRDFVRGRSSR
jgi:membrane protease subunit HflK